MSLIYRRNSYPCSKQNATGPCPEPDKSTSRISMVGNSSTIQSDHTFNVRKCSVIKNIQLGFSLEIEMQGMGQHHLGFITSRKVGYLKTLSIAKVIQRR